MAELRSDQYDAFADGYNEHAQDSPYNALYDRPATLAMLGDVSGKRILDAACGPGLYLEELIGRGANVIACDGSARMVELASERAPEVEEIRVQSLDDPLGWIPDDSIDIVLCALAYHYVTNRVGLLREMRRIMKPDGKTVISTHHPTVDWLRLGGSYFDHETLTETWEKGWEVTTWRMPLTDLTADFTEAELLIERLIEPQPHPDLQHKFPETFEKLTTRPTFIWFQLVKRDAPSSPE